jgi:CDP-paratose 2-epimerase
MQAQHILVTGGAGFVGSTLARSFAREPDTRVTAFDNLRRRGSELSLPGLARAGVRFVHGDVRSADDLAAVGDVELIVDCAAEPAASAGLDGATSYVLQTNLVGTFHCLELARRTGAALLFLSTSRVYPIAALNALPFAERATRFEWLGAQGSVGFSEQGISERFALEGARSLYGATKLSAELLITEYVHAYGCRALIDRCGVLAGPGQLSRVDQGVITHWVASHHFGRPLAYVGWGGTGKQVRDVLHVDDLFALLRLQLADDGAWNGTVYNVGGGPERALSLRELTAACEALTGRKLELGTRPETSPVDVRCFVTDASLAQESFGWRPTRGVDVVLADIHAWIRSNEDTLAAVLA